MFVVLTSFFLLLSRYMSPLAFPPPPFAAVGAAMFQRSGLTKQKMGWLGCRDGAIACFSALSKVTGAPNAPHEAWIAGTHEPAPSPAQMMELQAPQRWDLDVVNQQEAASINDGFTLTDW